MLVDQISEAFEAKVHIIAFLASKDRRNTVIYDHESGRHALRDVASAVLLALVVATEVLLVALGKKIVVSEVQEWIVVEYAVKVAKLLRKHRLKRINNTYLTSGRRRCRRADSAIHFLVAHRPSEVVAIKGKVMNVLSDPLCSR